MGPHWVARLGTHATTLISIIPTGQLPNTLPPNNHR